MNIFSDEGFRHFTEAQARQIAEAEAKLKDTLDRLKQEAYQRGYADGYRDGAAEKTSTEDA